MCKKKLFFIKKGVIYIWNRCVWFGREVVVKFLGFFGKELIKLIIYLNSVYGW